MKFFNFDEILANLKGYLESQVAIAKLEIKEDALRIAKKLIIAIILVVLTLFAGLFVSFSVAYYLNHLWQSTYLGFVAVSVLYITVILLVFLLRNHPAIDQMINKQLEE